MIPSMNDEDVNHLFERFVDESRRQFEVVAERLENKIQIVAEGVLGHNERFDQVDQHLHGIDTSLDRVETRLDRVESRLEGVDVRLGAMDERFDRMDERFDRMDQRFDGVDQRFDGVDQRFDGVDQRFDRVDQRFDGVDQRFDGVEAEMHREFDDVRAMIRLSYTELDRRLRTLEDTVSTLQSRMDRVESLLPAS